MKKTKAKLSKNNSGRKFENTITAFIKNAENIYLPGISIDTVIFSFHDGKLRVLLIRYGDMPFYNLPGGYVEKEETLEDAALRILRRRTGLNAIFPEQFYIADSLERTRNNAVVRMMTKLNVDLTGNHWFEQRFISVCFYALTDEAKVRITIQDFISEFKWFDIGQLPDLFLDHKLIVEKALSRLRVDLYQRPVGLNLMNKPFTMGELQQLYEIIDQRKLDRTNFQRKMLSMNILERLEKKQTGKAYKSPYLYRFKQSDN